MRGLLLTVALLSGCTNTLPLQHTANGHTLTGTMDTLTGHLTITIDSQTVIDGKLAFLGNTGTLTGSLNGAPVAATCATRYPYTECAVTLNNGPLGLLTF